MSFAPLPLSAWKPTLGVRFLKTSLNMGSSACAVITSVKLIAGSKSRSWVLSLYSKMP